MRTVNPMVGAWYLTENGHTTSVAHWLDEEEFVKNGGVMNHETIDTITKRKKPFTVSYGGPGFMLISKGVFENLEYPWWGPELQKFPNGIQDFAGEDVSHNLRAKELGIDTIIDPRVRVLHEKMRMI